MTLPLLQLPGAPELIIILLILLLGAVFGLIVPIGVTYWVYQDAKGRGNEDTTLWTVLTALGFFVGYFMGPIVAIAYLVVGRE
ncbi:hypothetical protein [Haloarcula amylovorans]|uniref:hypothetical protein n=1 Tax=Haloarcula amylovorans TaxID=2562280 RepID=UPI0010767122|nr:hypothetical protein [Halomicroarcula amylolytica]